MPKKTDTANTPPACEAQGLLREYFENENIVVVEEPENTFGISGIQPKDLEQAYDIQSTVKAAAEIGDDDSEFFIKFE